jgi:hypothetical protein
MVPDSEIEIFVVPLSFSVSPKRWAKEKPVKPIHFELHR